MYQLICDCTILDPTKRPHFQKIYKMIADTMRTQIPLKNNSSLQLIEQYCKEQNEDVNYSETSDFMID